MLFLLTATVLSRKSKGASPQSMISSELRSHPPLTPVGLISVARTGWVGMALPVYVLQAKDADTQQEPRPILVGTNRASGLVVTAS